MSNTLSALPENRFQQYRFKLSQQFAGHLDQLHISSVALLTQDYLDHLERAIFDSIDGDEPVNISQIQEMLLELSCLIEKQDPMSADEYEHFLDRLISIYARGVGQHRTDALTLTAPDYADVIETASQSYPDYDYSEALGQLLCYMGQIYHSKRSGWKDVYEHISAMPKNIEAIRFLSKAFFSEVAQWTDEGIDNLFQIRRDTQQRIHEMELSVTTLACEIALIDVSLPGDLASRTVVNFTDLVKRRKRTELQQQCSSQLDEIIQTHKILELIDENIDEFDDKLKELRLSYNVRPINSSR